MSKTTARLIMFLDCPRACQGCANTYPAIREAMQPISSLDALEPYEEILLTGGEPMYRPATTLDFLARIRRRFPDKRVYLYVSMIHQRALEAALPHLHGLQFTLHVDAGPKEVEDLYFLQLMLVLHGREGASYRLKIADAATVAVSPAADLWTRIDRKPWRTKGDCVVPAHEDLLIWESP